MGGGRGLLEELGEGVAEGLEAFAELGAIGGDEVGAAVGEVGALVGIALAVPEGCAEGLLGAEAGEDGGVAGVAQAAAAVDIADRTRLLINLLNFIFRIV